MRRRRRLYRTGEDGKHWFRTYAPLGEKKFEQEEGDLTQKLIFIKAELTGKISFAFEGGNNDKNKILINFFIYRSFHYK